MGLVDLTQHIEIHQIENECGLPITGWTCAPSRAKRAPHLQCREEHILPSPLSVCHYLHPLPQVREDWAVSCAKCIPTQQEQFVF